MRFPKPFGILCATALCASILPVRADDNPAQAAARAAVLQKMQEQDAAGTNVAPAATPPSAPVVVAPVITRASSTSGGSTGDDCSRTRTGRNDESDSNSTDNAVRASRPRCRFPAKNAGAGRRRHKRSAQRASGCGTSHNRAGT